ncbi:MAG: alpha/beta fold hydrolase [Elusimicrobiales bacterium]
MIIAKAALIAGLAFLPSAAFSIELNRITPDQIREITSDIALPEPKLAFSDAIMSKNGLDPVVITVPGLKFGEIGWGSLEIRNILRVFEFFFRDKEFTEADIVNGVVSFSPRYFFPDPDAVAPVRDVRLEDNYLEQKLKEIPGYENHDVIVIPFAWSRDPGDSKTVIPQLQARITEVCDTYRASGRPVYILAHSWGSMLAHTALHRAAAARPDLRVDKLITAGSPLVPANVVVKMFVNLEIRKEGLEKKVRKPSIVGVWRNFWAVRDAYSNAIPAADSNYAADESVENVEPTLIDIILHKKPLRKEARKDLFKIRDIKAWHSAYFFDYQASLKSIEKEISVEVFRPALAPQVMDCNKAPAAPMCKP